MLRAIADAFPHRIPYYKNRPAHPVHQSRWPAIDHRDPHPRSDDDNIPERLVTACWLCNSVKSDFLLDDLGWDPVDPRDPAWHGLTELLGAFNARVAAELRRPDAPDFRLAQHRGDRVVRRDPAFVAALGACAPQVRAGVARLETLAEQHGLSLGDDGRSRRIGADRGIPMFWLYPLADQPGKRARVEIDLNLCHPAKRGRRSASCSHTSIPTSDPRRRIRRSPWPMWMRAGMRCAPRSTVTSTPRSPDDGRQLGVEETLADMEEEALRSLDHLGRHCYAATNAAWIRSALSSTSGESHERPRVCGVAARLARRLAPNVSRHRTAHASGSCPGLRPRRRPPSAPRADARAEHQHGQAQA